MKNNVAKDKETKMQQTERVDNLQQPMTDVAEELTPADVLGVLVPEIINQMDEYLKKTELPLLAEFCAQNHYFEEFINLLGESYNEVKITLKVMETKKRSALERKIYSGELNATIGTQLLKSWRDLQQNQKDPPAGF